MRLRLSHLSPDQYQIIGNFLNLIYQFLTSFIVYENAVILNGHLVQNAGKLPVNIPKVPTNATHYIPSYFRSDAASAKSPTVAEALSAKWLCTIKLSGT